jgi:hypothetical protein
VQSLRSTGYESSPNPFRFAGHFVIGPHRSSIRFRRLSASGSEPFTSGQLLWNRVFIAGWKGALTEGIEIRETQRRTEYHSEYSIASLYADLGEKDQAFQWLNTAHYERDRLMQG